MQAHRAGSTVAVFLVTAAEAWVDVTKASTPKSVTSAFKKSKKVTNGDDGPASLTTSTHWISESGILDLVVFLGPSSLDILDQYTALTGRAPLPQYFALAYHQCRWNYINEQDVQQVQEKFDEFDIPMDVMWLDVSDSAFLLASTGCSPIHCRRSNTLRSISTSSGTSSTSRHPKRCRISWQNAVARYISSCSHPVLLYSVPSSPPRLLHPSFLHFTRLFLHPFPPRILTRMSSSQLVAIVDPHVKRTQDLYVYKEAQDLDILCKKADGKSEYEGHCWTGSSAWVDWFNPKSHAWWTGLFKFDKFKVRFPFSHSSCFRPLAPLLTHCRL
jgi:hypothetical protein